MYTGGGVDAPCGLESNERSHEDSLATATSLWHWCDGSCLLHSRSQGRHLCRFARNTTPTRVAACLQHGSGSHNTAQHWAYLHYDSSCCGESLNSAPSSHMPAALLACGQRGSGAVRQAVDRADHVFDGECTARYGLRAAALAVACCTGAHVSAALDGSINAVLHQVRDTCMQGRAGQLHVALAVSLDPLREARLLMQQNIRTLLFISFE